MCEKVSEQMLIEAAVTGDSSALEQLLLTYFSPLEDHLNQKLPDRVRRHVGVEDILQVTFSEVFRTIERFQSRREGAFFAWLRTIADHRLIDAIRKFDREGQQHVSAGHFANAESMFALIDEVADGGDSPSKRVRTEEAMHAMRIAIAGLPDDQREAICQHCLEHRSIEEIAAATGRTEGAVRGLIQRGKQKLAQAMGRSSRWLSSR